MNGSQRRPAMWIPDDSPFAVDEAFYRRIADPAGRTLSSELTVEIGEGRAFPMSAGQVCRIVVRGGSQVGDLNLWSKVDPRERFWAARTRQFHGTHVTTFDRLWSTLPWMRPMVTILADSIDYGRDGEGGRCHDLLGTRCDPYVSTLIAGRAFDHHCHSNLVRAVLPYGLGEQDVHDVLNVFQVTGLTDDGKYWISGSPARDGDYLELFAEIDLLCAMSSCPARDVSAPPWGLRDADLDKANAGLEIEVYDVDAEHLTGWHSPQPVRYSGRHGVRMPEDDE